MTPEAAAHLAGVDQEELIALLEAGALPGHFSRTHGWSVRKAVVEAYLRAKAKEGE